MITFKEYLNWLTEARIDDAKAKYPQHVDAIDTLNSIDPDPQKKYLPWLVKQHVTGNLELPQTDADKAHMSKIISAIGNPTNRKVHGITNYQAMNWNDVKSKVEQSLDAKSKREQKAEDTDTGIDKIYDEKGIKAFNIKTKDAAENVYGGGVGCGEHGTDWCISSRGNNNMFGFKYGKPYAIHTPDGPYAIHPDYNEGIITGESNDGDNDLTDFYKKNRKLRPAIDAVLEKHKQFKNEVDKLNDTLNNPESNEYKNISQKQLKLGVQAYMPPSIIKNSLLHPNSNSALFDYATSVSDPKLKPTIESWKTIKDEMTNLQSNTIDKQGLHTLLASPDTPNHIVSKVLEHPLADSDFISDAIKSNTPTIKSRITKSPNLTSEHIDQLLTDNMTSKEDLLNHKNISSDTFNTALQTKSLKPLALKSKNLTPEHVKSFVEKGDVNDLYNITNNKNLTPSHITELLKSNDDDTRFEAVRHPNASKENLNQVLNDSDKEVARNASRRLNTGNYKE